MIGRFENERFYQSPFFSSMVQFQVEPATRLEAVRRLSTMRQKQSQPK